MKNYFLLALATLVFATSCNKGEGMTEQGMKPIYVSKVLSEKVQSEVSKPFTSVGKLFVIGNKIYISDIGTGVHVIDNSNPSVPTKEAFISIYGNHDMAVKNNIMFADNGNNLLAINISDINQAKLTKRIENVYENTGQLFPSDHTGYFECVDTEKGFVSEWIMADIVNPKCRR